MQAEFSANAEKAAGAKDKTSCDSREIATGTQRANVQVAHLRAKQRDLKNRKRFGWTDDDAKANWPHAAGAYRRIESANKGWRRERHARLERSKPGRPGGDSLSGNMSNRRHPAHSLFPVHSKLDHHRAI